jgi:hypothetical protein
MPDPEPTTGDTKQAIYQAKKEWHRRQAQLPLKEKFRILLELQRQDLPLLQRLRPLKSWERPWEIDP